MKLIGTQQTAFTQTPLLYLHHLVKQSTENALFLTHYSAAPEILIQNPRCPLHHSKMMPFLDIGLKTQAMKPLQSQLTVCEAQLQVLPQLYGTGPAPRGAPLRRRLRPRGNRCGARGLLTSVSMGSTSIPFHSSSRWAIGMLPGDASQEERGNEIQLRKRWPPKTEGGAKAPERDPARDPPPARQDGSAPPARSCERDDAAPLRSPPEPLPHRGQSCGRGCATPLL